MWARAVERDKSKEIGGGGDIPVIFTVVIVFISY